MVPSLCKIDTENLWNFKYAYFNVSLQKQLLIPLAGM